MKLLEEVVKENPYFSSQNIILNACVARWVENLDGHNKLSFLMYPYIWQTFKVIECKL